MARTLKVGVSGNPPFVIKEDGSFRGISLDLWRNLAEDNGIAYRLIDQRSTDAGINAIQNGEIDLLIGPISITPERASLPDIEFTQPYYLGKEGVLLPLNPPTLLSKLKVIFGWAVVSLLIFLGAVLMSVGTLIWLAERKNNPEQFPKQPLPGITSGMWFALVTLTTVGYGDKSPTTMLGRAITSAWMITSLIAVSSLTASLASAFTVILSGSGQTSITNISDLRGKPVSIVEGTSSLQHAEEREMKTIPSKTIEEAVNHVIDGRAKAMLFDLPELRYYLKQNPQLAVKIAAFTVGTETYGFLSRSNNSLNRALNISILEHKRSGSIETIAESLLN